MSSLTPTHVAREVTTVEWIKRLLSMSPEGHLLFPKLLCTVLFHFWDKASLYSQGWPPTCEASASGILESQACAYFDWL